MNRILTTVIMAIFFGAFIKPADVIAQTPVNMNDDLFYTESGNALTNSGRNLRGNGLNGFTFDSTAHPLMNNGIFFPVTDYLGRNLWLRVRHMNNSAYPQSQFSVSGGNTNSEHLFGGWTGFFYEFDIYKDINLTGNRGNVLNGLFNTSIRLTSEETLSDGELEDLTIVNNNLTTAYWLLESINFTGNLPQSRPLWGTTIGGASPIFPEGNKYIRARSTAAVWSEFKLSANTVSQFTYGYAFSTQGVYGYQGITLTVGIEPSITICDPAPEAPLSVTTDDVDNYICAGNSITLTANDAVLTPGAVYQWYEGGCGVDSLLGTSSTLTVSPSAGVHQYYVRIKDNCGNYTDCAASPAITATAVPSVTIVSYSTGVCVAGSQYQFYATGINGGSNPVYQWQKNGLDISGETQYSYITSALAAGDQMSCTFRKADTYCGTAISNIITLADLSPTINITSNVSGTICAGTNTTFTANTTNAGSTPTYQWKLNGNNAGGNAATYNNATLINNDVVACSVNNGCKSANSNSLTMPVNLVPTSVSITTNNPGAPICSGDYVVFTATPTGMGTNINIDKFYWKKNGVTVYVANYYDSTYGTSYFTSGDVITCEMASSAACTLPVTSNSITMTVNPVPSLSIAITNGTNPDCSNDPLTFTASLVNGSSNISYEWHLIRQFPSYSDAVVSSASTYTLQDPSLNDVVRCDVIVSGVCSYPYYLSSNSITVKTPVTFSGYIYGSNGSSTSASVCANETLNFGAFSTNGVVTNSGVIGFTNYSPTYQWKLNGQPVGTNSQTYSKTGFTDGDIITCDVTSTEPCSTPATLTLSFTVSVYDVSSATFTVSGPSDICSGIGVDYSATATNAGPNPTYQWKKNGNDITGETGSSYTANELIVGDVITCVLTTDPVCASPATVNSNSIIINSITPSITPTIGITASNPLTSLSNTFTASSTNGGSNPYYVWYKNDNYVSAGYSNTYTDNALAVGDSVYCNINSNATCANPSMVSSNVLKVIAPQNYCTPSSNQGNQPCDVAWITNVQMGASLNKSTVCDGFYSDFTATDTLKAAAGETVSYTISGDGINATNWSQRRAIYIDFNNNKDFTDPGEMVAEDAFAGSLYSSTGTFTLPSPLAAGSYRIRVVSAVDNDFSPCHTNGGEAEDYTLTIGYCTPHSPNSFTACQTYYTSNVTLGTSVNNSTGCDGFYSDFSATQILTVAAGKTINYSVSLGSMDAQPWGTNLNIYIDYNNNGSFDDAGEKVVDNMGLSVGYPVTNSFTLPSTLAFGTYRIRVIASNSTNPCELDYGETEDYTLLIPEPTYCIPVVSQPCDRWISNTTIGSINVNNNQPADCNAGGYTDYTSTTSTTASPGQTVNVSLTGGSSLPFSQWQYADIFVDYNNDGVFDENTERVVTNFSFYTSSGYTTSFVIPNDQAYGYYRTRVKSYNYDSNVDTYTGPCGNSTNGAVQDFRLIVGCIPNGSNIIVQGNNTTITDGSTIANLADATDFGDVPVGNNASRTYTITNTGTGPLQITGNPTFSGGFFYYFSLSSYPTSYLLQPGESTTFTVQVNVPSFAYNYQLFTTVHVPTNNCDKEDYDFAVKATGTCPPGGPGVNVQGNGIDIAPYAAASLATGTDFGTVNTGNSISRSFNVQNTGVTDLHINNVIFNNYVDPNQHFTLTTPPASVVAPGSSTSFVITYTPTAVETNYTYAYVQSDDCDESSYAIRIDGAGQAPSTNPQVLISEIDYDNPGSDNNERVELYGVAGTDLTGWKLVLYNGLNGLSYKTIDLTGSLSSDCANNDGTLLYGTKLITLQGPDAIQNGAPDGMALVNAAGVVVQVLSYEGSFTATDGPAAGMFFADIAPGLADVGNGDDALERQYINSWHLVNPSTFGACKPALMLQSLCSNLTAAELHHIEQSATVNTPAVCSGGSVTLSIPFYGTMANASFQWMYSNVSTNGQWEPLGPVQNSPDKITTVTEATFYYCIIYCSGTQLTITNAVGADIYDFPAITTAFTNDCNTHTTLLSLTGLANNISYTYQWQKNVNNTGWNDIANATASTLSIASSDMITYRCNITACGGSAHTTSSEVLPGRGECWCLPGYTVGCSAPYFISMQELPIRSVSLNTLNSFSSNIADCNNRLYENFPPSGATTTSLIQGSSYNLTVGLYSTAPNIGGASLAAWIDYNDNYVFEDAERLIDSTGIDYSLAPLINIPLHVPANALLGMHRMRIREANGTQGQSVPACDEGSGQFEFGNTEDYTINVISLNCLINTWTSASVNGNWNEPGNWCNGVVPSTTDDIIIPSGNTPYPVLSTNAAIHNMEIQNGATVTLNGHTITINGAVSGTGTIDATAASGIVSNASTTLLFSPTGHTLTTLTVNAGTLTLGNALDITASGGTVTVANGATLASVGNLTLKSNQSGTARIAQGPNGGNYVTGNVTIERYIPDNGFRSWRLLSVPTHGIGQTIRQAWQEGDANPNPFDNNVPGYGTQITGTGNINIAQASGFDNVAQSPSLLRWNGTGWNGVNNTNGLIDNQQAYFLYIRGDRSKGVSGATNNSSSTTLRTTGQVFMGDQTINITAHNYALVPNLYPSAIDFTGLTRNGVNNVFYIWDSKKLNGNSLGVYQTFSATNDFNCMIGGGSYVLGQPNTLIESGQAFFVQGNSTGGSITLHESSKRIGSTGFGFRPMPSSVVKLETRLYNADGIDMKDASTIVFDDAYTNAIDKEDAPKIGNPGENLALETNDKILAVEGRKSLRGNDSVQFRIWNLKQQQYKLELAPFNINSHDLTAVIEDSYLKTSTPVNLTTVSSFNLIVDANAGSSAANRFRIVFSKTKPTEAKQGYAIAPNPVENGIINLKLINQPKGKYAVQIINAAGQIVFTKSFEHSGGTGIQNINLPAYMPNGRHQVKIVSPVKAIQTLNVVTFRK